MMDDDLHTVVTEKPKNNNIEIGNNVWIGANCFITKGINIGNGAVIAANSVITKDIPEFSLAGGNPAKIIRNQVNWN